MRRAVALAVTGVCAAALLAGCLGENQYCGTVKRHQHVLDGFGTKRTDAAFASYAKVARAAEEVAPKSIRSSWKQIAVATEGVIAAQKAVGISLQDSSDASVTAKLTRAQRAQLNGAYDRFNQTSAARLKVATDVEKQCGVKLAQKG